MFNSIDFDLDDDDGIKLPTFSNFTPIHSNVKKTEEITENKNKNSQKRKSCISPVNSNKRANKFIQVKRKFPGPAGVLPTKNSEEEIEANLMLSEADEIADNTEMLLQKGLICSQAPNKFISNVWSEISNHYGKLSEVYNIKSIQFYWNEDELVNQKVPFLAAMIKTLERVNQSKNSIINLTLEDQSGELQGTVHHNLYEKFGGDIKVGNILVLTNCSVLPSTVGDKPHLLITTNNLIRIYRKDSDSILLQNINADEFLKKINPIKSSNKQDKLSKISHFETGNQNQNNSNGIVSNCSNIKSPIKKIILSGKGKETVENKTDKKQFQFKKIQNPVNNMFQDDNFDLDLLNCDFDKNIDEKLVERISELENNLMSKDCKNSSNCGSSTNISNNNESSNNKINLEKRENSTSTHNNKNIQRENMKLENKICDKSDKNADIWKSAFEGIDVEDFFSDF